jgi:acetylornithine deacetylase/succinyl-diaminopimelate desuccinylase-like protein
LLAANPEAAALARLSANLAYNAQLRTTCVATMLEGGHASDALPQAARAVVNCRIMPTEKVADVRAALARVLGDDQISLTEIDRPVLSPPSALDRTLLSTIERTSSEFWPGTPVVPVMSAGATDGRYCAMPAFRPTGIRASPTMSTMCAPMARTSGWP